MATAAPPETSITTVADLLERLGVPPNRVRMNPAPGMATESDVLEVWDRSRRLCELVDGTLVEKTVGHLEGYLAMWIGGLIWDYLRVHDIGYCAGADAMMRLAPGLVRIPDVSFISWERLGRRTIPPTPIPDLAPDLAIEVLSAGNRPAEMGRKLREYFDAGVLLVWYIEPESRSARAFTSPETFTTVAADGALDGGGVLPGFALRLADVFARLA